MSILQYLFPTLRNFSGGNMNYHSMKKGEVLQHLKSDASKGLSSQEASERLRTYGANALPEAQKTPLIKRFAAQFCEFMIFVLFADAGISFAVSCYEGHPDYIEPLIILAIIFLTALLGIFQECRSEPSLPALRK